MSVIELKSQIINKVSAIEDESILQEIYNLIKTESEMESIHRLTEAEKKAIEAGMKDIAEGRVYPSEEARKRVRQWRKK